MKSYTRTVLAATLSTDSSYSSGPLDVGDLEILLVSVYTTEESGSNTFNISSVDANGNLFKIATITPVVGGSNAACVGEGSTFVGTGSSLGTNYGIPYFGDQIQIDQAGGGTISAQLSVKGR